MDARLPSLLDLFITEFVPGSGAWGLGLAIRLAGAAALAGVLEEEGTAVTAHGRHSMGRCQGKAIWAYNNARSMIQEPRGGV